MKVLHIAGRLAGFSVLAFFWLFCVEVLAAPVAQANDIYVNDTVDKVIRVRWVHLSGLQLDRRHDGGDGLHIGCKP